MNYYPNYNNQMYMQNFQELQNMRDRIDQQMRQMQQPMQNQNTPAINQTFQITPNNQTTVNDLEGKFVKSIDDVKNTLVLKTGVFLNSDYTLAWIKDASGNIRTFELIEQVELDEKDKQIIELQRQKENDNKTILSLKQEIENIKQTISNNTNRGKGADK